MAGSWRDLPVATPAPLRAGPEATSVPPSPARPLLVAIGASTGGPSALVELLAALRADLPAPVVVVQHMPADFAPSFVQLLARAAPLTVSMAHDGELLLPGHLYVAPPGVDLRLASGLRAHLERPRPGAPFAPSVDALFSSMAAQLRGRAVGLLLSGMGEDGAAGLLELRRAGARTIVQDESSSVLFGMPGAAIDAGAVEIVSHLRFLPDVLARVLKVPERTSGTVSALRRRVLALDDDPVQLRHTVGCLERSGYAVTGLDNPLLAAGALRRVGCELLVLESELTSMRAADLLRALRTHERVAPPVLLWSTLTGDALRRRASECGAAEALEKAAGPERLVEAVGRLLGRAPAGPSAKGVGPGAAQG